MAGLPMGRRTLMGAAALAAISRPSRAQEAAQEAAQESALTPILFVHGNGDHSALWMTTLWRFESNGWPRDRLRALDFTDPLARDDDAVPQPLRSSSEDCRRELAAEIAALRARTGAARVALVGNSRGGYPIRNHVQLHGGGAEVSHAITCGTPNNGIYDWDANRNREFNARSDLLRRLNGTESQVVPGTAFLTLRSDSNDLYAQPDGRHAGRPGVPTGVGHDSPELRGATNLVLPGVDHRETAYSARAFREMFRFVAGREPEQLDVMPEERPVLNGRVTGTPGGVQTNRPVAGATVEVYRLHPGTAERMGGPIHRRETGADGVWGPVTVSPDWPLEFVVAAPGHPITHSYRNPFPRSSEVVQLRPAAPPASADAGAGAVLRFNRPRGYFGLPRDVVLLDGREPAGLPRGVAAGATAVARLPAEGIGRPVVGVFNEERVVARAWPLAENRIAVAELTW
ncbi:hydrolase [Muricoccus pecuniae]|uniref:Pimeloyl-ACP methyl ester carboxylesterase n=1 Tax=Muricoccus pecuniae TaxID=693023 RepID=A0A840XZ14_9PROT|nr:hydrolase [Roseomonas pecuniae]MBB5692520.1 pimeloyl-ACP methyl ester carboxylesterase [Roseomonas pecuniae]